MSKYVPGIIVSCLILFASCKKPKIEKGTEQANRPVISTSQLNCDARVDNSRRSVNLQRGNNAGSPVTLLLDFNGQDVTNSVWSSASTISCPAVPSSSLTNAMKDYIFRSVVEDYSGFWVKVTKSEQDYQAAPPARRMRCVITYSMMDVFGNTGGAAIVGSMMWGDNTPCFIFCDVLQFNQKYIAGAVAHELGHTFGLQHQSRYGSDCTLFEEFHTGEGWGALGWAPIMGLSYYQNLVTWHNGQTILGCDQWQNDGNVIRAVAGSKPDDFANALNSQAAALPLTGVKTGILENASDIDAFQKKETNSRRIKVTSNGNSDLTLEVYTSNGQLSAVYNDLESPDVNVIVSGKKYIRIKTTSNQPYVPSGDGFGGYTITVSAP